MSAIGVCLCVMSSVQSIWAHVSACAQAWAEAKCVPVEELLHIYWIDMTIPGFNYNRSLLQSFSILSAALTSAP